MAVILPHQENNTSGIMSSENDVMEATMALKGILGIGTSPPPGKKNKGRQDIANTTPFTKSDKKKKRKEPKKKGKGDHSHATDNNTTSSSKVRSQTSHKKDRNNKRSSAQNDDSKNFAFSAFQSPPDASTLPLPVFSSGESSKHISVEETEKDPSEERPESCSGINLAALTSPSPPEQHKESLTSQHTDPATACPSHSSSPKRKAKENENSMNSISSNHTHEAFKSTAGTLKPPSQPEKKEGSSNNVTPISSLKTPNTAEGKAMDPIALLLNGQSYGTANPAMSPVSHPQHPYSPQLMQQPHLGGYPYQHPMMPIQMHGGQFVTVQVQVPPMLMPGRQMILPASPLTGGYPVTIVVPEGAQPGMVIPVTLKASPQGGYSPQHPAAGVMYPGPLGSPHTLYYQSQQQPYANNPYGVPIRNQNVRLPDTQRQNLEQQQQLQQQPHPQQESSTQISGSWAARAAALPTRDKKQTSSIMKKQ